MDNELRITDPERIIYSLNVEDLQYVADDELSRDLTEEEIKLVENKIGDYISWFDAISIAIKDLIHEQRDEEEEEED